MTDHKQFHKIKLVLRSIFASIIILVVLNAPFWVLGQQMFLLRPIINLDSAVIVFVAWWSPVVALVLVAATWVIDGLQSMSVMYHFQSTAEFVRSFRFAGEIKLQDYVGVHFFAVVGLFGLAVFLLCKVWIRWRPRQADYAAVLAIVVAIDIANGSSGATGFGRDSVLLGTNFAGSPMLNLVSAAALAVAGPKGSFRALDSGPAIEDLINWADNNPDRGILVVVIESFGLHRDAEISNWLKSQLYEGDLVHRWRLQHLAIPFRGATTSGELRTLCQLEGHYRNLTLSDASYCLPQKLKAQQWSTLALHGFSGNMFNRRHWWRLIGFERAIFAEDVPVDAPRCGGAFNGVCDSYLLHLAVSESQHPKSLTYLLTLNTHLPLTPEPIPPEVLRLCKSREVSDSVCQLIAQHGLLLRTMRDKLVNVRKPPLIVVVGDHAPPFSTVRDREQFDAGLVPLMVLTPVASEKPSLR
jgi:hypothetical protein